MGIKGLTDRGLAFPEIGQIRKGAKKDPTANRPGADLKHFRVEFSEFEKQAETRFREVYGLEPKEINVILPFNEIDRMWDAWEEAYTAGRLVGRSDGEFIQYLLDDEGEIVVRNGLNAAGERVPHPANNVAGYDYQKKPVYFKASGRLKILVPELARAAYITLMTTSIHDIGNISDQLLAFKTLNNGQIAGIPFVLRRRPRMISTPGGENNQRVRRQKWLVSIEADPLWVAAKLREVKMLALPDFDETILIPAKAEGVNNDPDIVEELDDDEYTEESATEITPPTPATPPATDAPKYKANGTKVVGIVAEVIGCDPKEAAQLILAKFAVSDMITEQQAREFAQGKLPA